MDPNAALEQWRKSKSSIIAEALRGWVHSGGFEPKWTAAEKRQIMGAKYIKGAMNENGLTFPQWLAAAGMPGRRDPRLFQAWKDGEDPSEYRAARNPAKKTKKPSVLRPGSRVCRRAYPDITGTVLKADSFAATVEWDHGDILVESLNQLRKIPRKSNPKGITMPRKKTARKATKRKNPTRHIPKTTRGRKPAKHTFEATLIGANDKVIRTVRWKKGSIAEAEMKAAKLATGKVARVILNY